VTMRLIGVVISFAPVGVAALLFSLTAELGLEILVQLARYVGVVLLASPSTSSWSIRRRWPGSAR